MNRRFNSILTVSRLPKEDWEIPRQQAKVVIQPWDFDTPVPSQPVWEGDTILLQPSRDESLILAIGDSASWDTFVSSVSLVIQDKNP